VDDLTIIYTWATGTPRCTKSTLTTCCVHAQIPLFAVDRDALHFLPTAHSLGRLEHFMAVAKGWTVGIARSIETIPTDLRTIRPTVIFSVPRIYENAYHRVRLRMERGGAWRRKIFNWGLSVEKQRIQKHREGKTLSWGNALAFRCVDR
jgi:long-chain acyl-CoA synthetase